MAEAIGAIASIFGIIGAGAKLSIALFDFASTIGSAGSEVRIIGTEISLFCAVLQQLERTLAKAQDRRYSISAIETTQKILDRCQIIFEEINSIVSSLQRQKSSSGEVSVDFKARLRWMFKRSEVQMHRATLESCKITLHLMLTTLEFAQRVSSRRISTVDTDVEDEQEEMITQSLLTARQCAVERLEQLEEEDLQSDTHDDDLEKLVELQENAQVAETTLAPIRALSRSSETYGKRNSVWLNDLIALDTIPAKTRRRPSVTHAAYGYRFSQVPHLLSKWTDQGEHWTQMHETPHSSNRLAYGSQVGSQIHSLPRVEQLNTNIQRQDSHDSYSDSPLTARPPNGIDIYTNSEAYQESPQKATTTHSYRHLLDLDLADATQEISKLSSSITPTMIPETLPPRVPDAGSAISAQTDGKDAKKGAWHFHDSDRDAERQKNPQRRLSYQPRRPPPVPPKDSAPLFSLPSIPTISSPNRPFTPGSLPLHNSPVFPEIWIFPDSPLMPSYPSLRHLWVDPDNTCSSILPAVLHAYGIREDTCHHVLLLTHGSTERLLLPEDKPKALYNQAVSEGLQPFFKVRKVDKLEEEGVGVLGNEAGNLLGGLT